MGKKFLAMVAVVFASLVAVPAATAAPADGVHDGVKYIDLTWVPEGYTVVIGEDDEIAFIMPTTKDRSVSVHTGCYDKDAACWTSGVGPGDFQFSGTGTARGTWMYRNSFYSGNRNAYICYTLVANGSGTCIGTSPRMTINHRNNITGNSVTRS